ncbi:MAG: four helix bundle protein [Bacteroidales bacterium]
MSTKIEKFEDLDVWKISVDLSVRIYSIFKTNKDFSFRDQICRSSVSIPSNIAEGFERQSNKEYIHFLYIAKGSAGELRTQLEIAYRIEYVSEKEYTELIEVARMISSKIYRLIQVRKDNF